jgi:FMN reductase
MSGCALKELKIIGICGSIRQGSFTKKALTIALAGASELGCNVEMLDLNDYQLYFCDGLPRESLNAKKVPNDLAKFKDKLKNAHGIIIATPEYHGSFSGVLKNALDLVGTEEFKSKVVGLVGVSGGAMGGLSAVGPLRDVFRSLHAWVLPAQALVPQVWKEFNDNGSCKNESVELRLRDLGKSVVKYSHLLTNDKAQEFLKLMETAVFNPASD